MSLIQTIQTEIISSLKSGDQKKRDALRFIVSQVKYKQIEIQHEPTDEDVVSVIRKQIKELTEAVELFKQGKRQDLVDENLSQIAILKEFLPQEISDEELVKLIQSFIEEHKDTYTTNPRVLTGKVVGALKSKASPERVVKLYNNLT